MSPGANKFTLYNLSGKAACCVLLLLIGKGQTKYAIRKHLRMMR
jgi:hypothetical protein